MSEKKKGFIASIASGLLYGIIPLIILDSSRKSAASSSFILMIRMAVAAAILLPFSVKDMKRKVFGRTEIIGTFVASALLTVTSILIYSAYAYIPSGVGISIHYTYPIICTVVGVIFFKEKPGFKVIAALLISVAGTVLLSDISGLGSGAGIGVLLAALSSLTFSCYLIWVERKDLGRIRAVPFTQMLSFFSAVILFLYNAVTHDLNAEMAGEYVLPFISVGVVAALAILLQAYSIKIIGAVYVSIFGTLEPIVCAVCGVLFLGEHLTLKNAIGIALVVAAVIMISAADSQEKSAQTT